MLISAKNIIKQSIELYQKNYQIFFKYLLLLFIPTGIMAVAGVVIGSFLATVMVLGFSAPMMFYLLIIIAGSIASMWISLALVRVMAARYENKKTQTEKIELQNAVPLILPAILASLLTTLAITGGLILLIIPGVIFTIWFAFSFYAVALDNNKVIESLKTSKRLVQGRWWSVWWRLFAPGIVFALFMILAQWLIGFPIEIILKYVTPETWLYAVLVSLFALLSTFVSLFFTPLTTAAPTILYLELKKTPSETEKILEPPQV